MSWRKSMIFAVDCGAVLAGVLIEVDPNRWTAWRHLLGGIP